MNPWAKIKNASGVDPALNLSNAGVGVSKAVDVLVTTAGSLVTLGLVAFIGKKGFDTMLGKKKK